MVPYHGGNRRLKFLTILCAVVAFGSLVAHLSADDGAEGRTDANEVICGHRVALKTGRLFLPERVGKNRRTCDLLVHFHGHPPTVEREFLRSEVDAALVVVNYPGLSSAYGKPMSDEALFGRILENAATELRHRGVLDRDGQLGRVMVSSFSAGYGAVREIFKVSRYFERVDGYLAADSIYAGLADGTESDNQDNEHVPTAGQRPPRPVSDANMTDFRRFAKLAAEGQKTFVISHSQLFTPTYASTVDTAEDLLRNVGVKRATVARREVGSAGTMRLLSRAEKGRFVVLGYAGEDGEAHMQHLRQLGQWLPMLARQPHVAESLRDSDE